MLEEDQMMRAIAMSLGQDIASASAEDQVSNSPNPHQPNQNISSCHFEFSKSDIYSTVQCQQEFLLHQTHTIKPVGTSYLGVC